MSDQTITAALPHQRRTAEADYEDFREHVAASCRFAEREVGAYYAHHDTYRDEVVEVSSYAAKNALRQVIGRDNATQEAVTRLLSAARAREEHLAREVAMAAFLAGYAYAVEAITGKLPAEGKDGEAA